MVNPTVSRDAACSASAVDPLGSSVTVDDKGAMSSALTVRASQVETRKGNGDE